MTQREQVTKSPSTIRIRNRSDRMRRGSEKDLPELLKPRMLIKLAIFAPVDQLGSHTENVETRRRQGNENPVCFYAWKH